MRKKLYLLLIALSLFAVFSCGPVLDTVTGGDTCQVSEAGLTCPSSDYNGSF